MSRPEDRRVVCIAGVVQGARTDHATADQGYRERIGRAVLARYPGVEVFCPVAALHASFASRAEEVAREFEDLRDAGVVHGDRLPALLTSVRMRFRELVGEAARADVLVAYVPAELSMGTAMEMWASCAAGRPVVTISPMSQNLAIVSTSALLVPTLEEFEARVAAGMLDGYLPA